jgi:flagellar export protein FliJ
VKAFRFRGARLLEWRRTQADQARVAFVRAAESARETAALLARAEEDERLSVRNYLDILHTAVDVPTIERYRNWIGRQRSRVAACERSHAERQKTADDAAQALQIASRHVKVMERLRDRAEQRHREAERQLEMKAIDELATMRFARRMVAQGATRD